MGIGQGPSVRATSSTKEDLVVVASTIDGGMLGRVWDELDYRIDVCRGTLVAHIERL